MVSGVVSRLKRPLSRKHFVQDGAEGKNIRAWIDGVAAHLFGGHVAGCAHHHAARWWRTRHGALPSGSGAGFLRELGQAEIEDLDPAVTGNENVLGFQGSR